MDKSDEYTNVTIHEWRGFRLIQYETHRNLQVLHDKVVKNDRNVNKNLNGALT